MDLAQGGSPWLPLSIRFDAPIGCLAGAVLPRQVRPRNRSLRRSMLASWI